MFKFGTKSLANLDHVHPHLVLVVKTAILHTTQDFSVREGLRTIDQEKENIRRGTSKLTDPRKCMHCTQKDGFSHAVDLIPFVEGRTRDDDWSYFYPIAVAMKQAANICQVRIRWGGVWDREVFALTTNMKFEVEQYVKRRKTAFPGRAVFLDGFHFELPLTNDASSNGSSTAIVS